MKSILVCFAAVVICLAACSAEPFLVPDTGANVTPGTGKVASAEAAGVRVMVNGDAWRGEPWNLSELMTPLQITIENNGAQQLRVSFADFALIGSTGFRYPALSPLSGEPPISLAPGGSAQVTLARYTPRPVEGPRFRHYRFLIAPHFGYAYPGYDAWTFGFPYDSRYYDERAWAPSLPSRDMLADALPEGVVEDGGSVSGFLYFGSVARESNVRFEMKLTNATTSEPFGVVTVPLAVRQR